MSSDNKRPLAEAELALTRFEELINHQSCCLDWLPAGSLRRGKELVGDIEIVTRVKPAELPPSGLFGDAPQVRTDALSLRLDELIADGYLQKQVKSDGRTRWGDRYKAVTFEGWTFEIFIADVRNFGVLAAIRTGSAEFSQQLVTRIKSRKVHRVAGGYLRPYFDGDPDADKLRGLPVIPCPTEKHMFDAAGMLWVPPARREVSA